jgi:hypothetical protein
MGRTIKHVCSAEAPGVDIRFSSQTVTKKCADALNDRFWAEYERHERLAHGQENPCYAGMLEIIFEHGGLSSADYERVKP